jgi:hypothetical protein
MSALLTPRRVLIFGAIGAAVLLFSMLGQSSDESSAAAARPTGERAAANRPASTLTADAAAVLSRLAHRSADAKSAGALFASRSWVVPPPPPPPPPPAAPPPPPTAPPLPFVFIGSYAAQGDQPTYFVGRGDRIYDLKAGDAVDTDYTFVAVDGANMIFNFKPLNARQSLALGGTP